MSDEFDDALEDAITQPDRDNELSIDFDEEEDQQSTTESDEPEQHGGDIDEPSHLDAAKKRESDLAEAKTLKEQWETEYQRRQMALEQAQEKYKELRRKVHDGDDVDESEEVAAQDAAIQARYALEKAKDSAVQANRYYDSIANQPQLAPAAQAWLDANQSYQSDSRFRSQVQKVMSDLRDQGYDSTHQAFYRKLDEKLRQQTRMGKGSRRTPGAPAVHTSKSDRTKDSQQISKAEAQFLKNIGRDPGNDRVRKQWMASKANTRRIAQARGFL